MKSSSWKILISGAVGLAISGTAWATPILGVSHDGDSTLFTGWISADEGDITTDTGSLTLNDAGLGNPGAGLSIDPTGVDDTFPVTELIYTPDALLTGDISGYAGMAFDFYANANSAGAGDAPFALSFYFEDSGERWYYDVGTDYISDGWGTYSVAFGYGVNAYGSSSWYASSGDNDADAFAAALLSVDRIGIELTYWDNITFASQEYGIDNFGLTVPEPETYMVLGMALLTMAFVFRKRITESLAEARTVMQM